MMSYMDKVYKGGFNFENTLRNSTIITEEALKKHYTKTGTTIVGVMFNGGVILAADTRATAGHIAEKNCNKIHFISKNITCCGAGTAADCEYITSSLKRKIFRSTRTHETEYWSRANGFNFYRSSSTRIIQIRRTYWRLSHFGWI